MLEITIKTFYFKNLYLYINDYGYYSKITFLSMNVLTLELDIYIVSIPTFLTENILKTFFNLINILIVGFLINDKK